MLAAEPVAHIFRDAAGVAWIDRTRVKVIEVALDHVASGWSAEEIHRHHPHLSLAQIHAALGYYYEPPGGIRCRDGEQPGRGGPPGGSEY